MHCKCDVKKKNLKVLKTYIDPLSFLFACFLPPNTYSLAHALFTFLLGQLKVPREDEDNAYAKLFVCVGGQEKRQQSVLWEMWKWRIHMPSCLGRIILCTAPGFSYNLPTWITAWAINENIYKILDRCVSASSSVRKEEMTPQTDFKI